ncbi:hypothetical protein PVAND_016220 [Polypedilum vanderplanki]|uniref:G-protein coupled receptors family 1 profile domain-containing protein n=1 Tax=Polypedilum vanderplanki TaxID=319348 RepID=A0A9J6BEG5_POLVA|nr:hypothetical protein PVAND_016220 [Polypedilum vanderplanki]
MVFNTMYQLPAMGGSFGNNMTVYDMVRPEIRHMVSTHWTQFPPMNPLWHSIIGFTIFILGILCMIGNYVVIRVFSSTKALRTPSNMLVVNLAFSDFLMMFTNGPAMVMSCWHGTWIYGELACELYAAAGALTGTVSIWTMTMIAFDRYTVIVKGLKAKPMTNGTVMIRIISIWVMGFIWSFAPLFGWNHYVPEGNMTACGTDYLSRDWASRSYIIFYALFVYWTPLTLICYSYFFIMKSVFAHEKNMREQAKKMNVASLRSSENANHSAECKLAKVALMTIALWFMAWTPYLIINYTGIFTKTKITPLSTIWGSLFAKTSAVYNPIVYAISHPKYRAALDQKYPMLSCAGSSNDAVDAQSTGTTATAENTTETNVNA